MLIPTLVLLSLLLATGNGSIQNKPMPRKGSSETSDAMPGGASSTAYDYVFVGGGSASIDGARNLAKSLLRAGRRVSILVMEKDSRLGGNVLDVDSLPIPAGKYNTTRNVFGPLPLKLGVGALRTNKLAMNLKASTIARYNLTIVYTPFRNIVKMRGLNIMCENPIDVSGGSADPYAFGDFCNNRAPFVDPTNEATDLASRFIGFDKLNKDGEVTSSPSDAFWRYVLRNVPYKTGEWDTDQRDGWSTEIYDNQGWHPFSGLRCDNNVTIPCPWQLAAGVDWRTFVERTMQVLNSAGQLPPGTPVLNQNYSNFMIEDNVGFAWDYSNAYDALSQLYYNTFEWNTASTNGYLPGGESALMNAIVNDAKALGVHFTIRERVKTVKRAGRNSFGALHQLITTNRTVYARKHTFLNLPPFYLFARQDDDPLLTYDGDDLNGDIIRDLRAVPQLQAVQNARTIKIVAQYEPGVRQWHWDLWDGVTGNYSTRNYGTEGCSSRIEVIDTPRHRCTNEITIVYSDGLCRRKWQSAAKDAEENGSDELLKDLVTEEAKSAFPWLAHKITRPRKVVYHMFDSAWHYAKWRFGEFTTPELATKATQPLGPERVSLIGEAYYLWRSGWIEGAMRSAKRAVERTGTLDGFRVHVDAVYNATLKLRTNKDGTFSDGSGYDGNGDLSYDGYTPSAVPFADRDHALIGVNERYGPFGPYNVPGYESDSCRPERYGVRGL